MIRLHPAEPPPLAPLRVLVLDGCPDRADHLRTALASVRPARLHPEAAANARAVLDSLRHDRHDAYLLAIAPGEQDALVLLREARKAGSRAPLLVLADSAGPGDD